MGSARGLEIDEVLQVFQDLSTQKAWRIVMAIESSEDSPAA